MLVWHSKQVLLPTKAAPSIWGGDTNVRSMVPQELRKRTPQESKRRLSPANANRMRPGFMLPSVGSKSAVIARKAWSRPEGAKGTCLAECTRVFHPIKGLLLRDSPHDKFRCRVLRAEPCVTLPPHTSHEHQRVKHALRRWNFEGIGLTSVHEVASGANVLPTTSGGTADRPQAYEGIQKQRVTH